jgi:Alanine racemase, C-terminal domain
VREHYAPIVGRISMDLTLADVTGIPGIAVGDAVILLGSPDGKSIDGLSVDALEHAELANSTPYEILCNISKRVPRKYEGQSADVNLTASSPPSLAKPAAFAPPISSLAAKQQKDALMREMMEIHIANSRHQKLAPEERTPAAQQEFQERRRRLLKIREELIRIQPFCKI